MKIKSIEQLEQLLEEGEYVVCNGFWRFWKEGGVCSDGCCSWDFDDIEDCLDTIMFMVDNDLSNIEVEE